MDDEDRVHGHQAAPRPHLAREEIRGSNRILVGAQKRLPRRRSLRHRWEAVRLENPRNRRPADAMPHVFQRALDSGVAPGRVVFRHPHRQPPDLGKHAMPGRLSFVGPLLRNELSMPAQQGIRCDDPRNLAERPAAQPERPNGEASSVVICQTQAPAHRVVRAGRDSLQSGTPVPPAPDDPTSRSGPRATSEEPTCRSRRNLYHRQNIARLRPVDRVMGHFGLIRGCLERSPPSGSQICSGLLLVSVRSDHVLVFNDLAHLRWARTMLCLTGRPDPGGKECICCRRRAPLSCSLW